MDSDKDCRVVRTLLRPARAIRCLAYVGLCTVMMISAAQAACTNPAGTGGDIIYNDDHDVMQYCDNTDWIAVGTGSQAPAGCTTIGQECSDGSVYAGLSPDGNAKMYTTHCDAGMTWNGSACTGTRSTFAYNNGNASGDTMANTSSTTDGDGNTALLLSTDADSITGGTQPHQAAQYCGDLTDLGHTNWYLPAKDELAVLRTNRVAIGGFELNAGASGEQRRLWSSSENGQFTAWRQNMPDGVQGDPVKDEINTARCVRQQPVSSGCANPAGTKGDILFNSASNVMQYCGGDDTWRAMGHIGGPPPITGCDTTPLVYTTVGSATYNVPAACDQITIQTYGAGGSGSPSSSHRGAGGGGGASVVIRDSDSQVLAVGGGGGGGGGNDASGSSRGGGGGYAEATVAVTGGAGITIYVGGGGVNPSSDTGGAGGGTGNYAGGKGGNRRQNGSAAAGTAPNRYGGAGGGGAENNGGATNYGGAGGAGSDGGSCGSSTNGGACSGRNGGGGGGYSFTGGTVILGSNGATSSGAAANGGPGNGGSGATGGNGRVVITPSGPPGSGASGPCTNPTGDAGDLIFSSANNTLQYCSGAWVNIGK